MDNGAKLVIGAAVLLLALGIGAWYFATSQEDTSQSPTPPSPASRAVEYRGAGLGVLFHYPDSYTLEQVDLSTGQRKHVSIILTRKEDLPPPQNGEGPPTITIDAFQNDLDKYTAETFVRTTNFTNFKLSPEGILAPTTVNGLPALSFRWSGLYEGRTVTVAREKWVYTFSVTHLTPQDQIILDFEDM